MADDDANRHKQNPAPALKGYSKEDIVGALQYFFGNPASPEKLRDYTDHHAM